MTPLDGRDQLRRIGRVACSTLWSNTTPSELQEHQSQVDLHRRRRLVACHEYGTTLSDSLPASWDHLVASYGTTRRVVRGEPSARLFASDVMFVDVEVNSCGVQGGQHGCGT